jgi:hypothetical protein
MIRAKQCSEIWGGTNKVPINDGEYSNLELKRICLDLINLGNPLWTELFWQHPPQLPEIHWNNLQTRDSKFRARHTCVTPRSVKPSHCRNVRLIKHGARARKCIPSSVISTQFISSRVSRCCADDRAFIPSSSKKLAPLSTRLRIGQDWMKVTTPSCVKPIPDGSI